MVKKCVAVGDIFITPEMMKAGLERGYEDFAKRLANLNASLRVEQ